MTTFINASTSSGIVVTSDNSGEFALQSNGVTKATIGANGLAAAGHVIQVVASTFDTLVASSGTSWVDSGVNLNITCKSANSKFLIIADVGLNFNADRQNLKLSYVVNGTTTDIYTDKAGLFILNYTAGDRDIPYSFNYLHSPGLTVGQTVNYKFFFKSAGGGLVRVNDNIGSRMTVMEIAQ